MSNLNSTSKLTEFPALEADEKADGRFSLSKFMFWRKADGEIASVAVPNCGPGPLLVPGVSSDGVMLEIPTTSTSNIPSASNDLVQHGTKMSVNMPPYYRSDSNLSNPSPEPGMDGSMAPFAFEARTLPNVLLRLSNLIAMGTNNQADIKKYWMPDSVSKECYECGERFTTFRRKHHCRICGQIFCSRCCNQEIPGKIIGYSGDLRVCVYCCKIVLSYLRSADVNSDLTDDLRVVQEDLQNRFGALTPDMAQLSSTTPGQFTNLTSDNSGIYRSLPRRKASVGYQEERFAASKEHSFNSFLSTADDKPKIVWDWVSLKSMWDEMLNPVTGMDWATHRHNMMKYCHSCAVGTEIVDWLLAQRKITWRGQGVQIGQLLIDANLIECVSQAEQVFLDAYALYKPVQVPLQMVQETSEPNSTRNSADLGDLRDWGQDPLWVKQIKNPKKIDEESEPSETEASFNDKSADHSKEPETKSRLPSSASLYSLDLNVSEHTVSISKPKEKDNLGVDPYTSQGGPSPTPSSRTTPRHQRRSVYSNSTTETMTDEFLQKTLLSQKQKGREMVAPTGWHSPQQLTSDSELRAFQKLCNSYVGHENELLNQLLENLNLSPTWADIILPIVHKVTEIVRPDVRHAEDEMDIRQYIQFKKIPGGNKEDCRIVNGVVCTKNVAHRSMRNRLKDPKILLIGSSIDYQRFENRFLSLEPLVMQEHDYLKNTVARIAAMKPDLVIVEKTVSRLAQDFMLDHGITLVINVKPSVMERVGRLTQGLIWESADTQIGRPQLGLCHHFYLETFSIPGGMSKTLMFFDGCAMHLGCSVLLRGGPSAELMKVKKVICLLMFVAYNWRLERSFHIDAFSMPPDIQKTDTNNGKTTTEKKGIKSSEKEEFVEAKEELINPSTEAQEIATDSFTDPLQISGGNTYDIYDLPVDNTNSSSSFAECLNRVILSASPFINYPLPYLETDAGKRCELRKFFPDTIYWTMERQRSNSIGSLSALQDFENNNQISLPNSVLINSKFVTNKPQIAWTPPHEFTLMKLTSAIGSDDVQAIIADFRRIGTRLEFVPNRQSLLSSDECIRSNASSWNTLDNERIKPEDSEGQIDALDPFKHQRLSVLFCSYSPLSANAPYFCVNPWVVNMDMYGRNDISLGMFLERYCFRKTYVCPARQCDTPMLDHIRKFVHYNGCVEVILRELQSPILGSGESILMWNWCSTCRTVSPIVPMSVDAWSLSFAKYLELRFYGYEYTRRGFDNPCTHSLHQGHQHYFAQHSVVAAFKFCAIQLWELSLPHSQISVKKVPKSVAQLIDDVKSVAILGHGVYTNISEVISSLKETSSGLRVEEILSALMEQQKAERSVFRSRIEDIQVNLASPSLHDVDESKDAKTFLWNVTDSISFLKCNVAETIQSWNASLNNFILQRKKEEKQAKDISSKPPLPRMESEPTFALAKELEDSLRSVGNLDLENPTKDRIGAAGSRLSVEMKTSSGVEEVLPVGLTPSTGLAVKRGSSPTPNISNRKAEHERTRSDGTEKILKSGEVLNFADDVADFGKTEKRSSSSNTVKTIISHFISGSGSVQVIQSPWHATEHRFQASLCTIPVPVFENEPSSVVAFALGSTEYRSKLKEMGKNKHIFQLSNDESSSEKKSTEGCSDEFQASVSSGGAKSTIGLEDKVTGDTEEEKQDKADGNIEIQFTSNSAKFYCRVYFAENFRQLRKLCLIEGDEFYVRSLARCVSWAASGGKSGSTFCKTIDDRFVIKQMSRFEIQSFLDFAPNYFEYMKTAFLEKKPTVLAKIFGVYRIGFKNSQTNVASKMDILIMENLFYERTISQKFDLKGSIRNRLANVTGKEQEDLVLLDENLVNMACENPMYIRPHTKTVLSSALSNDSRFLASQMVMDYSLLVGLDERKNELVVGIIDYIRTFTWDKKIETFVKSSGILGGQGKTPTVVSPTEYQTRFCEAMDRYFLLVPDRWLGLGLGIDS